MEAVKAARNFKGHKALAIILQYALKERATSRQKSQSEFTLVNNPLMMMLKTGVKDKVTSTHDKMKLVTVLYE